MLHTLRLLTLFSIFSGCSHERTPPTSNPYTGDGSGSSSDYGQGGSDQGYTLPFPSGEYWFVTQTYNGGSHVNYGFEYGDDRYAVDFAQSGCEPYGKDVTPIKSGEVMQVFTDGNGDHGYGNSVLIDHGDGLVSRYAHFSRIHVDEGDSVDTSSVIGEVGNSGYAVGSACPEHPGTHLHLALYQDGVAIKPEPLSGLSPINSGCWISREGWEDCRGNPGDYSAIDDEGMLSIEMLEHDPHWGTAQETEFVWVAQVNSPDLKPEATLYIYNERDDVTYDFEMDTESRENPWVFVYQKELRDSGDYSYWVTADNGDGNDRSSSHFLDVDSRSYEAPDILDDWAVSMSDDREFEWRVIFETPETPEDATLNLVNPFHNTIFQFGMDLWHEGDLWAAGYEKSLDDETVYPYWMTVDNGESISTTRVEWLRVND